jgi:hypothetical protein
VASPTGLQFREVSTGRFRDVTTGRFIPNPIGLAALSTNAQLKFALREVAAVVTAAAKELARREAYDNGDYYRSIRPASGVEKTDEGPAAIARVNAWDFKAGWIEFGTVKMPAKKILQRAAEASGYKVSVSGTNARRVAGSGRERVAVLK